VNDNIKMSAVTSQNTPDTSGNSISHQIINKLDEVKSKLTDMEYKELADLCLEHHKVDTSAIYELCMILPILGYFKCPCDGECCNGQAEMSIKTAILNLKVKILTKDANLIKEEIVKDTTITFNMSGGVIRGCNDKYKSLWSAIKKDKMFTSYVGQTEIAVSRKLDKYHHVDLDWRQLNIIKIKKL
jgi:hypothetical protein